MKKKEILQAKLLTGDGLKRQLAVWRFKGMHIVFTNGCFDILHLGHIDYLSKAADLGDKLIIGLNTDSSVQRLKGPGRPINDQDARALSLAALQFVDAVVLFDEDTPKELIETVQPDVLVKGADYKAEDIVGYDTVKARKGAIVTIELVPGYSTTDLIKKLQES